MHAPSHPLTHSLTHAFINSLPFSFTYSLTHPLTHSLTHPEKLLHSDSPSHRLAAIRAPYCVIGSNKRTRECEETVHEISRYEKYLHSWLTGERPVSELWCHVLLTGWLLRDCWFGCHSDIHHYRLHWCQNVIVQIFDVTFNIRMTSQVLDA